MVIYPICRTPAQARYLPRRYARKALARSGLITLDSEPEKLAPGQERLYSFYLPPMTAGLHKIQTSQSVKLSDNTEKLDEITAEQSFIVVAPRYSLPDGSVHSVYPPQGHTDNVEVLPHIVLSDPQLPWTRSVVTEEDPNVRNRVPWLAMLVFRQEELQDPRFAGEQSSTLAITRTLSQLGTMVTGGQCASPVVKADGGLYAGDSADTTASLILVQRKLFNALFKSDDNQQVYDVSRYKWLAHTRNINTTGMANSGIDGEEGVFSVVVSQRAGPLVTEPTDLVVHLVSIEHIPSLAYSTGDDRVALCSLENWTFTCLPPNSFNVFDALRHVGMTHDVFRISPDQIKKSLGDGQSLPARLERRLLDGFIMTNYRTETGEQTAAWMRGPLVPRIVSHSDEARISRNGQDLQIIDKETGIVDITYCVAWQLGKSLAVGNQGFTVALSRLSLTISREAIEATKKSILKAQGGFQDKMEILRNLAESLRTLRGLHNPQGLSHGPDARWLPSSFKAFNMSRGDFHVKQIFSQKVAEVTNQMTQSTSEGYVYNELNEPLSPDWMIVCSWVLDRMYLAGVPYHYYLPDPSFLPEETLRFFHIDRNWIDALVDGALSIGSHLPNDTEIRKNLKEAINAYLAQKPEGLHYPPQRPGYGFLLRSQLCIKFPDLIVRTYGDDVTTPDPTIIVRQENIAEGVLLVMFDRKPGTDNFKRLVLLEPPHQQCFGCGEQLKEDKLTIAYKQIYTIPLEEQPKGLDRSTPVEIIDYIKGDNSQPAVFTWSENDLGLNTLYFPAYAKKTHEVIHRHLGDNYAETEPTATLVGIQLNHPMYYLEVKMDPAAFASADASGDDDDGMLKSLKMVSSLESSPADTVRSQRGPQIAADYSAPVDWNAPFVDETERAQGAPKRPVDRRNEFYLPPPNIRRLAVSDGNDDPVQLRRPKTVLDYTIFPLRSRDSVLHVKPLTYRQDIIFSIRYRPGNDGFNLERITLSFPLGNPEWRRATLMKLYDGPGATMVDDFRFNVVPSEEKKDEASTFHLNIIPRPDSMRIGNVTNLSAMLSGVMVADYSQWQPSWGTPTVMVTVVEYYTGTNPLTDTMELVIDYQA
ncbi:hypothetical protein NPX13_g6294 [Xylaria arbuscula]|uniref:Uncharacterized protein n=1 Tax=Xylaria arbuscula TaxID=114810 RepID=A0A9W8NCG3_9PEZI|nr:hypothetical protein NPX13_g6294 [Xylaria arbuscula]